MMLGEVPTASIVDSVDLADCSEGPVDRYFTKLYSLDEDLCFMFHTNKVCVVTLARYHPLVKSGRSLRKIDFRINERTDRSNNRVSGKAKKGAQILEEKARLCIVEDETGEKHVLRAGIKGKLLEINDRLVTEPNLAISHPEAEGYIAIAVPVSLKTSLTDKDRLRSWTEYEAAKKDQIKTLEDS